MSTLIICGDSKKETIREYNDYFDVVVDIPSSECSVKNIKRNVDRYGEIYIDAVDFHNIFYRSLESGGFSYLYKDKDVDSFSAILITLNLISKILDLDVKLTKRDETAYFVLRISENDEEVIQKVIEDKDEDEDDLSDIRKLEIDIEKNKYIPWGERVEE